MSNLPLKNPQTGQPANDAGYAALMAVKPGERLGKARKERKLDIELVSEQLNLSPSVVKALEEDAYDALPNSTFIKGYIRSYARMLRLPGDDLVRAFEYQTGVHSAMDDQYPAPAAVKKSGFRYLILSLFLLGFIAVVGWLVLRDAATVPSTDNPVVVIEPEAVVPGAHPPEPKRVNTPIVKAQAVQAIAEMDVVGAEPVIEEPVAKGLTVEEPVPDESVPEESVENVSTVEVIPVEPEPAVIQAGELDAKLEMAFSEDCWVEIRDENGRLVHANLHRAGSRYTKALASPLDIKLGNGNAVKLTYNGSPVVFAQSKRSKVANLSIGR